MNRKSEAVDIIIPVYNGYEDLQLCIPSVKKYTDLSKHRVILINDCSPDERIAPYLDGLAAENILVFHNEKNLGFSGNVNKGMQLSDDRDVLLLNSDTIVTQGWLDKITACAYAEEAIATVTPLSNSATLCSVPVMCQDNEVPKNCTVDEYAALIERHSLHRYPKITVAVGFCMFIKRCVIDDIGYFDAETFGRGYGEENDFCNRAEHAGYHHVMCDDTFVYHKGTASFDTEEKQALIQAHDAILNSRYEGQMRRNHLYCMENPAQEIRDNIIMYTKLHNKKKNLLYVVHLDFRASAANNIGGTQIHVRELTEELRREYNVFVAARDGEFLGVTAYTEEDEIHLKFEIGEKPQFPVFHDAGLRHIFDEILNVFAIDLVHVHHTQDLSLEIYDAAHALGIPVIATLHDYYYACPTILLLDPENRFCLADNEKLSEEEQNERCRNCLWKKRQIYPSADYLRIWRREHERALSMCRGLIFPSHSAMENLLAYYPQFRSRSRVIYHGEDRLQRQVCHAGLVQGAKKEPKMRVRLDRIPGEGQGLCDIKGWVYLSGVPSDELQIYTELTDKDGVQECFATSKVARPDIVEAFGDPAALMSGIDVRLSSKRLSDGPVKIRVYAQHNDTVYTDGQTYRGTYRSRIEKGDRLHVAFLGGMVPQKGSITAGAMIPMDTQHINWFVFGTLGDKKLMEISQENCYFSSTYKKEELPKLLEDYEIDVVCILPIWAETFCYTVSEAWMNGLPVIGTDIGAVGERLRATGGGWLVSPDAPPEEILNLLLHIREHPEEYAEKKEAVMRMEHKSVAQMCGEYRALYKDLLSALPIKEQAEDETGASAICAADSDFIFQGLALGNPEIGGHGGTASMNRLRNENAALKSSIEVLKGTTSYRLARKIADVKLPFKEQIKKIVRRG